MQHKLHIHQFRFEIYKNYRSKTNMSFSKLNIVVLKTLPKEKSYVFANIRSPTKATKCRQILGNVKLIPYQRG